ncbi:amino acid permease [Rhabdochlamydiaceae symbiont of Dictyostelium giganteum]|uniref:amino acid permease n=1 Tax=Rhabdochlamydiaceae symbiont of Dictyostelium giganteum TaxID=3342349 RepID=UPI00384BAE57
MNTKQTLSVLSLVMINLAALGGIRTWAPMAESGLSSVFFLFFGVLTFFIPLALLTAELATTWPESGGVYAWVKKAFGHRAGYLAIWLLWIQNLLWFPTMLSFLASSITFLFNPDLSQSKPLTFIFALILFWGATFVNLRGVRASSILSSIGAIFGTFIPSIALITLGIIWFFSGHPLEVSFELSSWIPKFSSPSEMALLAGVIISLLGIEMSAVHAADVKDPQKNYPKAIWISSLTLILFSVLGVLSIVIVIPQSKLLFSAGCLQAFAFFFTAFEIKPLIPIMAGIITIGGLGSLATWIMGPAKGLIAAAQEEDLPPMLRQMNQYGVPQNFLFFQAVIVSLLSIAFLFLPSINIAYWVFLVLTTQLYLTMYFLLFGSVIKLRKSHPLTPRPFQIPGGKVGLWGFTIMGFIATLFALIVAFFPPSQIPEKNHLFFTLSLIGAMTVFISLPFLTAFIRKKFFNT